VYKNEFLRVLAQRLALDLREELGTKVSVATASKVLGSVLTSVVEVVSSGDEAKMMPLGRFYPKLIRRRGKPLNVKLGFSSYPQLDTYLTHALQSRIDRVFPDEGK